MWLLSSSSRSSEHLALIEPFWQLWLAIQLPRISWRCRYSMQGLKSFPSRLIPTLCSSPQSSFFQIFKWFPATPGPFDILFPCQEHMAFSSSCGWQSSHLQISGQKIPLQRRLAWPLDLGGSFITDWPLSFRELLWFGPYLFRWISAWVCHWTHSYVPRTQPRGVSQNLLVEVLVHWSATHNYLPLLIRCRKRG